MRRTDLIRGTIAALILLACAPMTRADEPQSDAAKRRATWQKLDMPLTFRFREPTPLEDVLRYIKSATQGPHDAGLPIFTDPAALEAAGKTMKSPIRYASEGVPLKTTFRALLKPLGLDYAVRDDGVVAITLRDPE